MTRKIVFSFIATLIIAIITGGVFAQPPEGVEEGTPKVAESVVDEQASPEEVISSPQPLEVKSHPKTTEITIESSDTGLLTLNVHQVDIQELLSAIALNSNTNIVTASDVSGKISVHLFQVTLDEALNAITLAGALSYMKEDTFYYIYKPKEERDPEANKLQVRIFELKYAAVEKVQEVLDALPGKRMIKIHEASKTVIVEDTPENIKKIELIINFWDRIPKQVMIEAQILEIVLTDEMSLGVNWEHILGEVRIGTGGFSTAIARLPGVSPIPSGGAGLFASIVGVKSEFTAALNALKAKTTVNTLSTPKILAIHSKPARVQVGGQQGYKVTTTNVGVATETVEFIETGTILEITPYIDDENKVLLKVKPSVKSARLEEGIPVVATTEVSTWMMAQNGETVLIGGLITESEAKTRESVPGLGCLWGIGLLFRQHYRSTNKSELVVLITPQVRTEEQTLADQEATEKTKKIEEELDKEPQFPNEVLE